MNTIEGLATSSTAIVSRLRCSTLSPEMPGFPTRESLMLVSSIRSIICNQHRMGTGAAQTDNARSWAASNNAALRGRLHPHLLHEGVHGGVGHLRGQAQPCRKPECLPNCALGGVQIILLTVSARKQTSDWQASCEIATFLCVHNLQALTLTHA